MKIYLIAHNAEQSFSRPIFHNYMQSLFSLGHISDWWHYLNDAYLVATQHDVNQLYNAVFPGVPKRNLLIIEVDPNNAQGWLPPEAWQWIQKYQGRTQ